MTIEDALTTRIQRAVAALFPAMATTRVEIRPSIKPEFGDLSSPVALPLAKQARRSPLDVAQQLRAALQPSLPTYVRDTTVTPPGFINFFIDAALYAGLLCQEILEAGERYGRAATPIPQKIVVEHTNINSNKAAHVGHLRNACLGDTVVRILRANGYTVEAQNYIDDTGVQVADVIVGFRYLGKTYDGSLPFDFFCSQIYTEVQRAYQAQPALLDYRRQVLRDIEDRTSDIARFAKELSTKIVTRHIETMSRVNINYDLLTWESDILALGFWKHAFDLLTARHLLEHPTEGELAGCWVVPFGDGNVTTTDGQQRNSDKVLVKSDGVVTYTGKDLAYQMWKFGLLDLDFGYRLWATQLNGLSLWTTTHDPTQRPPRQFGHANRVVNVIDARQAYPQEVVYETLRRLGYSEQAEQSTHLSYQVVALSAGAAEALGVPVEPGKMTYAFSGRQGIEVKADELLDMAAQRLSQHLSAQRSEGRSKSTDERIAERLAVGAVRYYLLKFNLQQIIPFDFDDALRNTGDTGIYLQYAYARACNILERTGRAPEANQPATLCSQDKNLGDIGGIPRLLVEEVQERRGLLRHRANPRCGSPPAT
ncbi:MAG: arginine--tRNA ligase [Chloroflexi bacterium]|nr:arginine--tRNA ligase [Chloroflexota bacterium]